MGPPDDNFSFDFFDDEPLPAEGGQGLRGRLPQRGGGRRATPPRPVAPVLRLLALVCFVIFLLLVFVLLVSSCAGQSRHAAYASYLDDVNTIAQQSSADGSRAVGALTFPGLSVPEMVKKLDSIASAEQQNVAAAQSLSPPGRLRSENAALVEALQLRVLGLDGLAAAFTQAAATKQSAADEAVALSQQAYRLLASDIIWEDLFAQPAAKQLSADGVGGVTVPESHFLDNPNLIVTPDEMQLVVTRIIAAGSSSSGTCTGLHGTALVSVQALANGVNGTAQTLTPGTLNTVTSGSSLIFRVTIQDSGDYQEVQIPIQLTIARSQVDGGPITKTATVQLIDPGSDASVLIGDLGDVPFAAQTTLSVNVKPVCGETNIANNSAQYSVIFSLPN